MSFKVPWERPYPDLATLPPTSIRRLTVEIPKADADAIISVTTNSVILTTICQYAIKHTADLVRTHNLTYADSVALCEHICKRTYSEFVKEAIAQNVGGGTSGILQGGSDVSDKSTGTREKAPAGRTGKGGTSAKGGKK